MIPMVATYRLQLNKQFTFQDAAGVLDHIAKLGVSHIYLSPLAESTSGSNHGYDVADFAVLSSERGGEEGFQILALKAQSLGLKLIIDIVPNHMGIAGENPYWMDVLQKGGESDFAGLFDLRTDKDASLELPILEKNLEETIAEGKIKITIHPFFGLGLDISGRYLPLHQKSREELQKKAGNDVAIYIKTLDQAALIAIINSQYYRPVPWTKALDKISYRRFFDVTDLIGVRIEDEKIYKLTHGPILDLLRRYPVIEGVRVDHIDGLAAPSQYLRRLKGDIDFIWVEKILCRQEQMPSDWDVLGTTGYEFIQQMNMLFTDTENFKLIENYWIENIQPQWNSFSACVEDGKNTVLDQMFPSELKRLVTMSVKNGALQEDAAKFWRGMTVHLPVYRTYYEEGQYHSSDKDCIMRAYNAFADGGYEDLLQSLLNPSTDEEKKLVLEWQQLTGPAMAKGLEDTAHYRYTPLANLNEVGCEAALEKGDYFQWAQDRITHYPWALLASSTHDTKRSEDARCRLYALSDNAQEWLDFFEELCAISSQQAKRFGIDRPLQYFFYQNLIASWPEQGEVTPHYVDRMVAYMGKSAKEMKLQTNWLHPNQDFENYLERFVRGCLSDASFVKTFVPFAHKIFIAGINYSFSALTLKILGPGVPDIYQGCENWNSSLVDPDNRRAVNFAENASKMEKTGEEYLKSADILDGGTKIALTQKLLHLRKDYLLNHSPIEIEALSVPDGLRKNILAYRIGNAGKDLIVLTLLKRTLNISAEKISWAGLYKDKLTGQDMKINNFQDVVWKLESFPVAVLTKS